MHRRHLARAFVTLIVAAIASVPAAAGAHPGDTTYSGRAYGVYVNVLGLVETTIVDTGEQPPSGAFLEDSLVSASVPGVLSTDIIAASSVAGAGESVSQAIVNDTVLTVGGNTITAAVLFSKARAFCNSRHLARTSGFSSIAQLVVNGQTIQVTGAKNQTINLGVGQIIINEQIRTGSGAHREITVNALHVDIPGIAEVVIASSTADITCGTQSHGPGDCVNGAGWINGPSGGRATFSFHVGIRNNGDIDAPKHVLLSDENGPVIEGVTISSYTIVDAKTTLVKGAAKVDGASGFTYELLVVDNGQKGAGDTFSLEVSNGYSASGVLQGGDVDVHSRA